MTASDAKGPAPIPSNPSAEARALRAFFDTTEIMHGVIELGDDDARVVVVNKAAATFLDRPVVELSDRTFSSLGVPAYVTEAVRAHCTTGTGPRTRRFDVSVDLPDLGVRELRCAARFIGPGTGGPQFALNVEDVTESTTAVHALRRTEQSLAALVKNLAGAAYRCRNDERWTVEFISDACLAITGYRPDEIVGNRVTSLGALIHPDDAPAVWRSCQASLADRRDFSNEYRIVHRDGTIRWVLDRAQGIYSDSGQLDHIEGLLLDITQQRLETDEIRQLNEQLLHTQRVASVGKLAGGIAHDFNNLLAVVLGHADLLGAEIGPASPLYEHIAEIRSAADRSVHLTRQLLGFARRQPISPQVVDLNKAVGAALRMLRQLIGESIEVAWAPGDDVWPVNIDPTQLDQVLTNLCVNSRDAMADGGVLAIATRNAVLDEDFVRRHPGAVAGDYVQLQLADTGVGMDEHTLVHVFDPFFTTKEVGSGTGLGMATVYGIMKQNHGYIAIESAPGAGTTVDLYFPRHRETAEIAVEVVVGEDSPRGTESILLVEDDVALLRTARLVLESLGYSVVATHSPVEAAIIATTATQAPNLLVTDVIMPAMNGRVLANHLQTEIPSLRVLFMSGYAGVTGGSLGSRRGTAFLAKPFTAAQFATKVREVLDAPV